VFVISEGGLWTNACILVGEHIGPGSEHLGPPSVNAFEFVYRGCGER